MRKLALAAFGSVWLIAWLMACSQQPTGPVYENPLDPDGTISSSAFALNVVGAGELVAISFVPLPAPGVVGYVIQHSDNPDGPFTQIPGEPTPPSLTTVQLSHTEFIRGASNYYRLAATNSSGIPFWISKVATLVLASPPTVSLPAGGISVAARTLDLIVRHDVADSFELAHDAAFSDGQRFASSGLDTISAWTLPAAAQGDTLGLWVRGVVGGVPSSLIGETHLVVDFSPVLGAADGLSPVLATVALTIEDAGLVRMRFAASEAGLAGALWEGGAASASFPLDSGDSSPQTVWAEFEGDFAISDTTSIELDPVDAVGLASIVLAGGATTTTADSIMVSIDVEGAAEMRLSEDPSFTGTSWIALADSLLFSLSPAAGEKTVYAVFRNDWDAVGTGAEASITRLSTR